MYSQIKESITENIDTNQFKNWLKYLLVCNWRYLSLESFTLSKYSQFNPWVDNHATRCIKFCVFLSKDSDIELTCTCLPERTCKYCLREGLLHSMFILFQQCSTVNIYKYKGKYVLKEFLMLLMDRNFNPFATCILNKQGNIINGNIPVALRCVTFFSHTCKWAYLSSFLIQKSF